MLKTVKKKLVSKYLKKDNSKKRFISQDNKISNDKLVFLKAISNVVQSGMNIIGVDTPEKM